MDLHLPFTKKKNLSETADETPTEHWFEKVEQFYGDMLIKSLPFKWLIFGCFIIVLMVSGFIVTQKMKFVMFPNEETRDIVLTGEAAPDANHIGVVPLVIPMTITDPATLFPTLKNLGVPIWRFGEYLYPQISEHVCENSVYLSKHVFQFPCHPELTDKEIDWMVETIKSHAA